MSEAAFGARDLSYWEFTNASIIYADFSHRLMDGTLFRRWQIG